MQKIALGLIVFGLVIGLIKYLDHRGDQEVIAHQTEMAKKSVDEIVSVIQNQLPVNFLRTAILRDGVTIVEVKKVNDLTVKKTIQLPEMFSNYSGAARDSISDHVRSSVHSQLCKDEKLAKLLNVGMVFNFEVRSHKKELFSDFVVNGNSCGTYTS